MIEEIKKLNRYKITSEVILPNRIYAEIIETVNLGKVLEILDNQPDYKSAWNELKNDNTELIEYGNRAVKDCKLYKNRKMYLLEQKYNLGGE